MVITFNVTQEHIHLGMPTRCKPRHCPVARALNPLLKEGSSLDVGLQDFLINNTYFGELSPELIAFIDNILGAGGPVKPSTFSIDIPERYLLNH